MTKLFFICLLFLSSNLFAQDQKKENRAYSPYFNGDFVELSFRTGLSKLASDPPVIEKVPESGQRFELGLRQALPMHLLDTRLALSYEVFPIRSQDSEIALWGIDISGAFHPFYLALLFENWFAWVLASIYVEAGAGIQYATLDNTNDVGFSYSFGGGFDLPLWNPNHGWSLWLNGLYRYRRLDFDNDSSEIALHNHTFFAGLAIRWNGLLF